MTVGSETLPPRATERGRRALPSDHRPLTACYRTVHLGDRQCGARAHTRALRAARDKDNKATGRVALPLLCKPIGTGTPPHCSSARVYAPGVHTEGRRVKGCHLAVRLAETNTCPLHCTGDAFLVSFFLSHLRLVYVTPLPLSSSRLALCVVPWSVAKSAKL